jgi:hypothetical protein
MTGLGVTDEEVERAARVIWEETTDVPRTWDEEPVNAYVRNHRDSTRATARAALIAAREGKT